jgi:hypothetical protein|tara:strand:+ start:96 stop:281 length:186 start_codon:yes stop_codon:yes gene_type:complete
VSDPLVDKVCEKMKRRAEEGILKYGDTMRTANKPFVQWIVDAQEEAMDFIVYLEKIKEGLE